MNKKIIEGLEVIATGLLTIVAGLKESEVAAETVSTIAEVDTPVESRITKTPNISATEEERLDEAENVEADTEVEETDDESDNSGYTEEQLSRMTYNNLKKLAKELGVSAVGTRKELVNKILSASTNVPDAEEEKSSDDKSVEEAEVSRENLISVSKGKGLLSKKQPELVEEESVEEEDEDEEEVDPVEAKILEETEDMTDDEIRKLLEDVGMPTKGKRQALISRLVDAVNEGLIALEEEEDEEVSMEVEESVDIDESEDDDGDEEDITESMTKKRRKTFEELCDDTEEQFESGEIAREDITDFLISYDEEKYSLRTLKKMTDEDLLTEYLKAVALMIDDDGNVVEEGAYTINEEPYCCGHPLAYDEKKNRFTCEHCGGVYEAD